MPNSLGSITPPSSLPGRARSLPPPLNLRGSDGGGPPRALQPGPGPNFFFLYLSRRHSAPATRAMGPVVVTYVEMTGTGAVVKRRPWRRRAESQATRAARETLSRKRPGTGHRGRRREVGILGSVCFATVLSKGARTRSAVGWDGDSDGGGESLPLGPVGQAERAEGGSQSVNSSREEARQARMMRFMGGW